MSKHNNSLAISMQQAWVILGTLIITTLIVAGTLILTESTPSKYLLSSPYDTPYEPYEIKTPGGYTTIDPANDVYITGSRLDYLTGEIARIRDKANTYASDLGANIYIDGELESLDDQATAYTGSPTYTDEEKKNAERVYKYLIPRVLALRREILTCDTKPSYLTGTNATFVEGQPTLAEEQTWQNTSASSPCYYTCKTGYSGSTCEASTNTDTDTSAVLVEGYYSGILDRASDSGGLAYWKSLVDSGSLDSTTLPKAMACAAQGGSGRDKEKSTKWLDENNITCEENTNTDTDTSTGTGACNTISGTSPTGTGANANLVRQNYRDILCREGDQGGFDYWKSQVDSGSLNSTTLPKAMACAAQGGTGKDKKESTDWLMITGNRCTGIGTGTGGTNTGGTAPNQADIDAFNLLIGNYTLSGLTTFAAHFTSGGLTDCARMEAATSFTCEVWIEQLQDSGVKQLDGTDLKWINTDTTGTDTTGTGTTGTGTVCPANAQPGTVCAGNTVFAFSSGGISYMTTPGNCTDSANPTCDGGIDSMDNNTWMKAVTYCDNMNYGGYSDWVLPSVAQLKLFNINKNAIGGFVSNHADGWYWSDSASHNLSSANAMAIDNGAVMSHNANNLYFVRCIRNMDIPNAVDGKTILAFTDESGDYETTPGNCTYGKTPVICDGGTDTTIIGPTAASSIYCGNLNYGGHNDWRVPIQNQLDALYMNRNIIGGFASGYYVSDTRDPISDATYMRLFGNSNNSPNYYYFRCIRKK